MGDTGQTRKLAAILAADVAGYSRLMALDDAGTLQALNESRAVFRECIERHAGHVIDMAGDSVLAEIPSALEAVRCAVEVQAVLRERNQPLPAERRMLFRIGINVGDIIEQADGTIYGDGVNIAARLESIGEPCGVCLSGTVYDQVKNRIGSPSSLSASRRSRTSRAGARVPRGDGRQRCQTIQPSAGSGRNGTSSSQASHHWRSRTSCGDDGADPIATGACNRAPRRADDRRSSLDLAAQRTGRHPGVDAPRDDPAHWSQLSAPTSVVVRLVARRSARLCR